jgi:uncharacterized protein DUF2590
MPDIVDLRIENNDFVFGDGGEPLTLEDAAAIAQDMKHRIRESGLVPKLVGARGAENQSILQDIKLVAREEERIKPDSIVISDLGNGQAQISALTIDDLSISLEL